jgi:hypothetical protein
MSKQTLDPKEKGTGLLRTIAGTDIVHDIFGRDAGQIPPVFPPPFSRQKSEIFLKKTIAHTRTKCGFAFPETFRMDSERVCVCM